MSTTGSTVVNKSYNDKVREYMIQMGANPDMKSPSMQKQTGAGGSLAGAAGSLGAMYLGKKYLAPELKDLNIVSSLKDALGFGSTATQAVTPGVSGITSSVPGALQSIQPTTTLADIQSLSNGGSALQSTAPEVFQSIDPSLASTPETSIGNFAGSATPYLGAAGTAYGAYNAYQGIKNKNPMQAGLGGLGAGLGINAMGYALGPWGWGAMLAAPAAGALINALSDKDRWKTEGKRLDKLRDSGVNWIPLDPVTGGRSKQQLIDIEQAKIDAGKYGNIKFAQSRNEADLNPEDIWGYSAFGEKFGNDWLGKFDEAKRRDIAQQALNAKAVNEHHGTIDIDWNKIPGFAPKAPEKSTLDGKIQSFLRGKVNAPKK